MKLLDVKIAVNNDKFIEEIQHNCEEYRQKRGKERIKWLIIIAITICIFLVALTGFIAGTSSDENPLYILLFSAAIVVTCGLCGVFTIVARDLKGVGLLKRLTDNQRMEVIEHMESVGSGYRNCRDEKSKLEFIAQIPHVKNLYDKFELVYLASNGKCIIDADFTDFELNIVDTETFDTYCYDIDGLFREKKLKQLTNDDLVLVISSNEINVYEKDIFEGKVNVEYMREMA